MIFPFALLLFLFSCGSDSNTAGIELNQGEKWKINTEMMPHLEASEKLVVDFTANDNRDYKALAKNLKKNAQSLISSCTMNGKSHDELHKWLHPYMGLIDDLAKTGDKSEANQVIREIEQSFETFDQYFH